MKTTVTAKLKLLTTPEQARALRATQLAYRDALNALSHYAFAHSKTSSVTGLHRGMYGELRTRYHLPSQLACSAERQVAATYKGLWTKLKKNSEHRKARITKKRFKGLDQPPHYSSPTVQYTYERDYTFKCEQQVSVGTLEGRIILSYLGYHQHVAWIQQGASIGAAKLWYDQPKKRFYLLVSLAIEVPDPSWETQTEVVGVDVGIRYFAVTSTATGTSTFHAGSQAKHRANHYARLRKRLQHKGTRHAKQIVAEHPHALIGLEQLTGIRERTRRKTRRRKQNGKGIQPGSRKQRKANRVYSQWTFAELHALISYKAVLSGSVAASVDADYTSQACPCCGYTSERNRPGKGLLFVCRHCGYSLHADLLGARNVLLRTLLLRQDWSRTGRLSVAPDGSDKEAKAERLKRYSELRWSSVPSLRLAAGGH